MSTSTSRERPTYGNWIERRSPGIAGSGMLGTAIIIGGMIVTLFGLMLLGYQAALVLVAIFALAFFAFGTKNGKRLAIRTGSMRARRRGEHQFRSGLFSKNKKPHLRLPGMAAKMELLEYTDPYGNPFAVVKYPKLGGLYTIVARAVPEGPAMQDADTVDGWVAGYARVLESCGQETALVAAKAITDTAPDPGGRLGAMVTSMRADGSPDIARQIMDECVRDYPAASSENATYLELTFKGRELNRKGEEDKILSELARRVPGILGQLETGGGGSVDMVSATELPRIVRAAYDPQAQADIETAVLQGEDANLVPWSEAGPVAAQDFWDRYVHDSGVSVTHEMFQAPRTEIRETAIGALVSPHHDFARKRVALIYQPHAMDESLQVSERDLSTATFVSKQTKKRMTASAERTMDAARRTTKQVAAGAVMVSFSLMVTVTTYDSEGMLQGGSTLKGRAGAVPVRLRPCYGSQAAAFATTLPMGFLPWEHTVIPAKVREWM